MSELHLETPRLRMHALSAADEALFCELFTDRETMQFIGRSLPHDRAARSFRAALRANSASPRRQVFLCVLERTSNQPVGICTVQNLDLLERRAELGMMIRPLQRGRGFGKEALAALVGYAFRLFPIEEAFVQYDPRHLAAERLVMSTGFSPKTLVGVGANEQGSPKRICSAFRESWDHQATWKQLGESACRT